MGDISQQVLSLYRLPPAKIVDLGRVDFGPLVSEGEGIQAQAQIPDLRAGHTYAIWTREDGIAVVDFGRLGGLPTYS